MAQFLLDDDKRYLVSAKFGQVSSTGDSEGKIVNFGSTKGIDESSIRVTLLRFIGDINQVPPMYSALKVQGKRLYQLAREGKVIDRKPRKIRIDEIKREVRMRREDIDGLIININIDSEDLLKKMKKIIDEG